MNTENTNYNNTPESIASGNVSSGNATPGYPVQVYGTPAYPVQGYAAPVYAAPVYKATGVMKTSSRVMRLITLCLFIAAMLVYYLPTLLNRGYIGIIWLAVGVVQAVIFSAIFFRDSRTRTALSIVLMVFSTMANLALALFISILFLMTLGLGLSFVTAPIYFVNILIAVTFALCFPRKYHMILVDPPADQEHPQPQGFQHPQGYQQSQGYQQPQQHQQPQG